MRHVRCVAIATVRCPGHCARMHDIWVRLYADIDALVERGPKVHVLKL